MLATMHNADTAIQLQTGDSVAMLTANDRAHGYCGRRDEDLPMHQFLGRRPSSFLSKRGESSLGSGCKPLSGLGQRRPGESSRTTSREQAEAECSTPAIRKAGELPAAAWAALVLNPGLMPAGGKQPVVLVRRVEAGAC